MLEQLQVISDMLARHKEDLAFSIETGAQFMGSLAEAIGSGPFFKSLVVNLIPYQALQPFVDAAFKKRGIDPEEFWRNAGLPAFQFPDPNGTRTVTAHRRPPPPRWREPRTPGSCGASRFAVLPTPQASVA